MNKEFSYVFGDLSNVDQSEIDEAIYEALNYADIEESKLYEEESSYDHKLSALTEASNESDATYQNYLKSVLTESDYNELMEDLNTLDIDEKSEALYEVSLEYYTMFEAANYKDSVYGLPEDKKYPMPDEAHVRSAIKFFNYVSEDKEKELADNILKKIKKFKIKDINVGDNNRFNKYYTSVEESADFFMSESQRYLALEEEYLNEGSGDNAGGANPEKLDVFNSDTVVEYLDKFTNINNDKKRSKQMCKAISHVIGKLCAKIKHNMGQSRMYKSNVSYDGYIKNIIPNYFKYLDPKDLWQLKKSIIEHGFTTTGTGIVSKSLKDITTRMENNGTASDKDNFTYQIAFAVRKDLSNILHMIDRLYEGERFKGTNRTVNQNNNKSITRDEVKSLNNKNTNNDEDDEDEDEDLDESTILEEKAKIKGKYPDEGGYFNSNIKFKGAKVVICSRYKEEAQTDIPVIKKAFENVKDSYKNILATMCDELGENYINNHPNVTREMFNISFYKNKLQNRIVAMRDSYGVVFEFVYGVYQYLDGNTIILYIKTDMDGLVEGFDYKVK